MAWDFETDPEFQTKLDWIEDFMREEVEAASHLGMAAYGPEGRERFIKPLQTKVKEARQILRDYAPTNDLFPAYHLPRQREAARERFADDLKAIEGAWKARRKAEAEAEPVV